MTETKLEPKVEEFLKEKGYRVLDRLGEGFQRDVYEAEYSNGSLRQRRVIKIPKKEIDESSIAAVILRSKGDIDEKEVLALNNIQHPNVVKILDAFKLGDKTITVEEHYDAKSLEDMVKMWGSIKDPERFRNIFGQVLAGLDYLHGQGLIHRDIKPSNILIGKENFCKISDLQTTGKQNEIESSYLPTRGGTRFTSPFMLNALMQGKETLANLQSEFYALGATMYYALTGELPFNIELVSDDKGKQIIVNEKEFKVTLKFDGEQIAAIENDKHEKQLKRRLSQIPRQYRKILYNCLSEKNAKYTDRNAHSIFGEDLKQATSGIIPWEKIKRHVWAYTAAAAALTGIIGGIGAVIVYENHKIRTEPPIYDSLRNGIFPDSGLEFLIDNEEIIKILQPHFKELKEKGVKLPEKYEGLIEGRRTYLDVSCESHNVSKKMVFSLLRSIVTENEEEKRKEYGEERYVSSLLPKSFAEKIGYFDNSRTESLDEGQKIAFGAWYLKHCLGNNDSVPEVFATYLCSQEEIFEARKKAGNMRYFPTIKDGKAIPGYGEYLSPLKQKILNRALALQYITDPNGKIHTEVLDDKSKPINGLAEK